MTSTLPTVSVIIPAREAAETLPAALESIQAQTYGNIVDVVVAAADAESKAAARTVRTVDNPSGSTPVGLNLALKASDSDIVVRCDAHAVLPPGYVERAVATLKRTGADNVGGIQRPQGSTEWETAIASAMSSPVGAGDARYRIGGTEGEVETVYLGVFKRSTLEALGGFDESFTRNQDYELNHRIIASGGRVWFDPELKVQYRPRGSLAALGSQYFQYGRAKRQFARKHSKALRLRQMLPPLLVIGTVVAWLGAVAWPWLAVFPLAYVAAVFVAGLTTSSPSSWKTAAALITMHFSWGWGFLRG